MEGTERAERVRIWQLDALKGFAVLLVVAGHIADGYLDAGLFPEYRNILQAAYDVIYSFHMPLFFILSGIVFYIAYAREREKTALHYKIQLINLAAVYVLFSVIQWVFKMLFAQWVNSEYTLEDLLLLPVRTMAPYWYLYVLLLLYLICRPAEKINIPETVKLAFFLAASVLSDFMPDGVLFEIKNTLYYSFFFYLGIVLPKTTVPFVRSRFLKKTEHKETNCASPVGEKKTIGRKSAGPFVLCGRYCLEIYVTHCFITAANRMLLLRIGITNFYVNIFVNLLMATVLPVLAALVLKKLKLHMWIFRPASAVLKKKRR